VSELCQIRDHSSAFQRRSDARAEVEISDRQNHLRRHSRSVSTRQLTVSPWTLPREASGYQLKDLCLS